jgi:hypothetical protein
MSFKLATHVPQAETEHYKPGMGFIHTVGEYHVPRLIKLIYLHNYVPRVIKTYIFT